jgi:hypothetical protein
VAALVGRQRWLLCEAAGLTLVQQRGYVRAASKSGYI